MEKVFIKDKQGNKVLPITHVSAVLDDEGNDLGSHLGNFEDEVRGLVDTPHQEYVTVATYASLPASGSEDTIYRVSNYDGSQSQVAADVYSEYAWDGTQYVFLCVKSQVGEVFDISAYHNNATYADLNAALTGNTGGVPSSLQKGGMSVKFVQSYDNNYVQWRLISTTFSTDPNDWVAENEDFRNEVMREVNEAIDSIQPIEITGDVTNAPDEEDLTSVNVGGTDVLKFKDKAYNPLTYSGLGRKILRKNIVNGVNTLTQSMINQANTIYVIQYDFTLGEDITIPANCVLEFDGGSIAASGSNDTIVFNQTYICTKKTAFVNCRLDGTVLNTELHTSIISGNDADRINDLIGLRGNLVYKGYKVVLDEMYYTIDKPILIKNFSWIEGCYIVGESQHRSVIRPSDTFADDSIFILNENYVSVLISNIQIWAGGKSKYCFNTLGTAGSRHTVLGLIKDSLFSGATVAQLAFAGAEHLKVENCRISGGDCGVILTRYSLNETDLFDYSKNEVVGENNDTVLIANHITDCRACAIFLNGTYNSIIKDTMTGGNGLASIIGSFITGLKIDTHNSERDGGFAYGHGQSTDISPDRYYNTSYFMPNYGFRAAMFFTSCQNVEIGQIVISYKTYIENEKFGIDAVVGIANSTFLLNTVQRYSLTLDTHDAADIPIIMFPNNMDLYSNAFIKATSRNVFVGGKILAETRNKFGLKQKQSDSSYPPSGSLSINNTVLNISKELYGKPVIYNRSNISMNNLVFDGIYNDIAFYRDNAANTSANHSIVELKNLRLDVNKIYKATLFIKNISQDFTSKYFQLVIYSTYSAYVKRSYPINFLAAGEIGLTMLIFKITDPSTSMRLAFYNNNTDSANYLVSKIDISELEEPIIDFKDLTCELPNTSIYSYNDDILGEIKWNQTKWQEMDGALAGVLRSGASTDRPVGSSIYVGFQYFDTTMSKPVYASAISGDTVTWVDATGVPV